MPHELTNAEKMRRLPWGLAGDALNVAYFYLAFAGSIFLLFLQKQDLNTKQIGFLLAIFPFCGLVAPFTAPIATRLGLRRVFLFLWILRKFILALLILTPVVVVLQGKEIGFLFVAIVLVVFAICRSIAENSSAIWSQEFIPTNIRGKYTAIQMIITTVIGATTVSLAGWYLGPQAPISKFQILFVIAFVLGIGSVVMYRNLAGGEPDPEANLFPGFDQMLLPLKDHRFLRLLFGQSLVCLGWIPMCSFLPVFFRDYVGLPTNQVVQLDAAVMLGALCTSFLWGWAADRFGSKPVMITGLCLHLVYPIGLLLMPRVPTSHALVVGVCVAVGSASPGWNIGYARYLFVNLVPAKQRAAYVALHTAWCGFMIGIGPIIAGQLLGWSWIANLHGSIGPIPIDSYTPFFVFAPIMVILAAIVIGTLPSVGAMDVTRFALMFVQGNPLAAMQAMLAFQFAGDEQKRINTIERLGQTRSPLNVVELISALDDPSFNVRHEAIVSIARTRQDPRLTEAMVRVLRDGPTDLQTTVAWALGRMGDPLACQVLRESLDSPYPLLRARAARALGMLNDQEALKKIRSLFEEETDPGIRVAYAAALGALGCEDVLPQLLAFLRELQTNAARMEMALIIATMLGKDEQALRLWRRMIVQPGDTLSGVLLGLRKRLAHPNASRLSEKEMKSLVDKTVKLLGSNDLTQAVNDLSRITLLIRLEAYSPAAQIVLPEVTRMLDDQQPIRNEYIYLAVHALHVGMLSESNGVVDALNISRVIP